MLFIELDEDDNGIAYEYPRHYRCCVSEHKTHTSYGITLTDTCGGEPAYMFQDYYFCKKHWKVPFHNNYYAGEWKPNWGWLTKEGKEELKERISRWKWYPLLQSIPKDNEKDLIEI